MENTLEIRVYCGTYAKYNNGSIFGEWLTITGDTDMSEFWQECRALHSDESDPEFMFQDYEAPNLLKGYISECHINKDLPAAIQAIQASGHEIEALEAFAATEMSDPSDIDRFISDFEDVYQGQYDSDEDFAQNMAEECGMIDPKLGWPYTCIDWEWAARELMHDYCEDGGHYFSNI